MSPENNVHMDGFPFQLVTAYQRKSSQAEPFLLPRLTGGSFHRGILESCTGVCKVMSHHREQSNQGRSLARFIMGSCFTISMLTVSVASSSVMLAGHSEVDRRRPDDWQLGHCNISSSETSVFST